MFKRLREKLFAYLSRRSALLRERRLELAAGGRQQSAPASRLHWVLSEGGPHILIPTELAPLWEGTNPPSGGRVVQATFRYSSDPNAPATDYDAACSIEGIWGRVSVGSGHALVIDGEIPFSTWLPSPKGDGGYIVVPLFWQNDRDDFTERIPVATLGMSYADTGLSVSTSTEGLRLFPATDSAPDWRDGYLAIDLALGSYSVGHLEYSPDEGHVFRVFRLRKVGGEEQHSPSPNNGGERPQQH